MGGTTPLEGRVEVFHLGHWGTVCDSNWDFVDAIIVCRQLGYPRAVEAPRYAAFGAGSGPSWYYRVYCTGTERNLTECSKSISNTGSACSHSRDAGAVCSSQSHALLCICMYIQMIEMFVCVHICVHLCMHKCTMYVCTIIHAYN